MTTGEKIKEARKKAKLSQKELGTRLGVSQAMIGQYESGKRNPKPETLKKIADALEVPISSLSSYDMMVDSFLKQENLLAMDIFNLFAGQPTNIAKRGPEVLEPIKEDFVENADAMVLYGRELLDSINKLNKEGQQKVKDYADDLAENPKYRKAAPDQNTSAEDPEEP